jgi:hypothetical protein
MGSPTELPKKLSPVDRLSNNAQTDGVDVPGPLTRPGRAPSIPVTSRPRRKSDSVGATRDSHVDAELNEGQPEDVSNSVGAYPTKDELTEIEGAEGHLRDLEADKYGPLTEEAMRKHRRDLKFDPRNPIRPLRVLPIGRPVPDTDAAKEFRKFAYDNDLPIKLIDNPKISGTESHNRYRRYQPAKTLRQIVELSTFAKSPAKRQDQQSKARRDIENDFLRGYILFPQNENPSASHFVSATELAKANATINIHALYSRQEMRAARAAYLEVKQASMAKLIDAFQAKGFLTFHEQLQYLWDDVPRSAAILAEDESGKLASPDCAAFVSKLIGGDSPEPSGYKMAIDPKNPEREAWLASMARERGTLEQRGTWDLVPRKSIGEHRPVRCKYVFKRKRIKDGTIQYKSRLVACGYSQVAGDSFSSDETYAGVCSYASMRFVLSYACQKGYILSQTDISSAYLESFLEDEVYMMPPPDMYVDGKPPRDKDGNELVCKLKRGLYGLKQAGFLWSQCFKDFMLTDPKYSMGFVEMTGEPNLYRRALEINGKQEEILVAQYVDDCLISSSSEAARIWFMERLEKRFPVNPNSSGRISFEEPGLLLSMNVRYDQKQGILQFDQKQAIELLAEKLGVTKLSPRSLPMAPDFDLPKLKKAEVDSIEYLSIVGSCLHICQVSRPDCSFAVGVLARHSATPGVIHREAAIDLVKYLYHTRDLYIQYTRGSESDGNDPQIFEKGVREGEEKEMTIEERLVASKPKATYNSPSAFVDADYAGDKDTRRSTSGWVVTMNGGPISWQSKLQKLCAQSSAESEIYAVVDATKEAIHIKLLCEETGIRLPGKPMRIWEDNNACIQMGHGLRGYKAAKHYEVRLRFLHERIRMKEIEFARISTKDQLADGFTKALPGPAFEIFRGQLLQCNKLGK